MKAGNSLVRNPQRLVPPDDLKRAVPSSAAAAEAAARRPLAEVVAAALTASSRSEHTRRSYRTAIGLFLQHLDRERGGTLPRDLEREWRPFASTETVGRQVVWDVRPPAVVLRLVDAPVVDSFREWREESGDNVNAASTRVAAVRTFLAVAYRDGVLTTEQAQALGLHAYRQKQKRDLKPVGRRLSPAEVRALRSSCDTRKVKGKRDLAVLDTMLFLGLRREESATLSLSDFRQDGGRWWLVLTGKGGKTRRLKVHDALYKSLSAWLGAADGELGGEGRLFRSVNKGDRVTGSLINASVVGRLVAEYGHAAQIAPLSGSGRLGPHDLRRTCARVAYDRGAPLLLVQAMLGHSDVKTTAHYIGAFENDEETAVDFVRY
jgi:integrase